MSGPFIIHPLPSAIGNPLTKPDKQSIATALESSSHFFLWRSGTVCGVGVPLGYHPGKVLISDQESSFTIRAKALHVDAIQGLAVTVANYAQGVGIKISDETFQGSFRLRLLTAWQAHALFEHILVLVPITDALQTEINEDVVYVESSVNTGAITAIGERMDAFVLEISSRDTTLSPNSQASPWDSH